MKPERNRRDDVAPIIAAAGWRRAVLLIGRIVVFVGLLFLMPTGAIAQESLSKDMRRSVDAGVIPVAASTLDVGAVNGDTVGGPEDLNPIPQVLDAAENGLDERTRPLVEWAVDQVGFSKQESWAVDRLRRGNRMHAYTRGGRQIHETEWLRMIPSRKGYLAVAPQEAMQLRTVNDRSMVRQEIPEEVWAMIHRVNETKPEVVPVPEPPVTEDAPADSAEGVSAAERQAEEAAYAELMRMFDLDSFKVPERVVPGNDASDPASGEPDVYVPFVLPSSEAPVMIREGSQAGFEIRKNQGE
ncbi:MAG: hypothetical protein JW706_10010 [Opitutales bacterium]|nr:hypothetical protein [Opitutales bacterium]